MSMNMNQWLSNSDTHIFIGNFGCETLWSYVNEFKIPMVDLLNINVAINNMDELFIYLANERDIVIVRNKPDDDFLCYLRDLGVLIPSIYTVQNDHISKSLGELIIGDKNLIRVLRDFVKSNISKGIPTKIVPYGVTCFEEELSNLIGASIASVNKLSSTYNNKLVTRELLETYDVRMPKGYICVGVHDLNNKCTELLNEFKQVAIKGVYGSGGSNLVVISSVMQLEKLCRSIKKFDNNKHKKVIVEGWYTSKVSYNYQFVIDSQKISPYIYSEQILEDGKIQGSIFANQEQVNNKLIKEHFDVSLPIAQHIAHSGYKGILGFDSIISENGELFPIVDINCRINLSTIFYAILSKYFKTPRALFCKFDLKFRCEPTFYTLFKILGKRKYNSQTREGIVIINFNSVKANSVLNNGFGIGGRLFIAVFSNSKENQHKMFDSISTDLKNYFC